MGVLRQSLLPVALALSMAPAAALADDAENEALARRFYAEFNARDFAGMADVVAAGLTDHTGDLDGGDGLIAAMQRLAAEISDIRLTVERIAVSGDFVTVIVSARGTGGGMMPADQHIVSYTLIDVWLVADGMLAEVWRAKAD